MSLASRLFTRVGVPPEGSADHPRPSTEPRAAVFPMGGCPGTAAATAPPATAPEPQRPRWEPASVHYNLPPSPLRSECLLREHSRVPLAATATLIFETGETLSAQTLNVSEGGIFLETRTPLPVGTQVRFELACDETVTGYAEVAWIRCQPDGPERPPGMGMQFRWLAGEGRAYLRRRIAELRTPFGS